MDNEYNIDDFLFDKYNEAIQMPLDEIMSKEEHEEYQTHLHNYNNIIESLQASGQTEEDKQALYNILDQAGIELNWAQNTYEQAVYREGFKAGMEFMQKLYEQRK